VTRRGWLAFAALSAIWGVPYMFIRIAVRGGMPPLVLAWARVTLAAVILLVLARRAGTLPTLRGRWRPIVACGVAEIAVPFSLIATGERHIASSLAAIVIAAVPLIVALLAIRFDPSERPTAKRAVGLVVGFAGVVALMGIDVAGSATALLGTAAVLVAAVGYATGPMIIKRWLGGLDGRAMMGASLTAAAVLLTPLAVITWPARTPSAGALISTGVLGVLCTAAALTVLSVLIAEAGPGRATVITYVNPVIAVALGVVLLGERPGAGAVAGLMLILAGSWLSTSGRLPARRQRLARPRGTGELEARPRRAGELEARPRRAGELEGCPAAAEQRAPL
jgi:drug/metabolite transporter (DMT)-like permease